MKTRYYIGGGIIVIFLAVMVYYFTQTDIEYVSDFNKVMASGKTCKATGTWVKDMSYIEDRQNRTFTFYIKDAKNNIIKVIYQGIKPNNFEVASSVVVTGKFKDGYFHATDVLTKCPSKYEGQNVQMSGT